jgi:glycosyltransferase involved in cell wall biosynthesis
MPERTDMRRDDAAEPPAGGGRDAPARPFRVCFISPLGYGLYNPGSRMPFGGAEVQAYLLSRELARDRDFEVTVLATVAGAPAVERHDRLTLVTRTARGRRPEAPAQGMLAAPARWLGYGRAFADMRRQLGAIGADCYVHAGGAGVEVGAYALICRLLRKPFVYLVVSSADLDDPHGKVAGPLKGLYRLGLRLADAVVCRTEEQRAALKRRYGRESLRIPSACEAPAVPPEAGAGKTGLLWVGRGHPLKQPELFLDLAARLPGERCAMVVMQEPRHPEVMPRLRARAAGLANLTLHEDVPWREVGRLFEGAKLLVNTSTYEGFPTTFVQAAMQAVPILSWSVDPDGVLTRHGIGVCAGGSFERLAAQAEQLCASEPQRVEMARRARDYARGHHDLRRVVEQWKDLVRALGEKTRR